MSSAFDIGNTCTKTLIMRRHHDFYPFLAHGTDEEAYKGEPNVLQFPRLTKLIKNSYGILLMAHSKACVLRSLVTKTFYCVIISVLLLGSIESSLFLYTES